MTYEKVLQTIKNILDNDLIVKEGLTLVYQLDKDNYKQLDEEIHIQLHGHLNGHTPSDMFETELGGVLIKFFQKDLDTE